MYYLTIRYVISYDISDIPKKQSGHYNKQKNTTTAVRLHDVKDKRILFYRLETEPCTEFILWTMNG